MRNPYKIVLFGAGNVAYHFSKALLAKGFNILQVVGRSEQKTKSLAEIVHSPFTIDLEKIRQDADVYLYCISDDSLNGLINLDIAPNAIHIHTAGSVSIDIFSKKKSRYGVIYPLQTLSKTKELDFPNKVPLFVEGSDPTTLNKILEIARTVSNQVTEANSSQRLSLHISAVFACNFVNHFYHIAENILQKENISFDLLKDLIAETADKINYLNPSEAQTGPAKRKDRKIMQKHLNYLEGNEDLQNLYSNISELIYKANKQV